MSMDVSRSLKQTLREFMDKIYYVNMQYLIRLVDSGPTKTWFGDLFNFDLSLTWSGYFYDGLAHQGDS
jgi:hypothetical protein